MGSESIASALISLGIPWDLLQNGHLTMKKEPNTSATAHQGWASAGHRWYMP